MISSRPLLYDVPQAAHLLRRDLRDIRHRCSNRVRTAFGREPKNLERLRGIHRPYFNYGEGGGEVDEESRRIVHWLDAMPDQKTQLLPHWANDLRKYGHCAPGAQDLMFRYSEEDTVSIASSDGGDAPLLEEHPTVTPRVAAAAPPHGAESSESKSTEGSSTLYELLDKNLKAQYKGRDRELSNDDRWRFRGSWLLLYTAIQSCSSKEIYNIFRDGKKDTDGEQLLVNLVQMLSATKTAEKTATRLSKMPSELYANPGKDHNRYDSAFTQASRIASSTLQYPSELLKMDTSTQMWYAILEASTDSTRTVQTAKDLINRVWPEEDATDILDQIGNPQKHFGKDDELQLRLRKALFPEYEALTAPRNVEPL